MADRDDLVTKTYLDKKLGVTERHFDKKLKKELTITRVSLKTYFDDKLDDFREEVNKKFEKMTEIMLEVLKEVRDKREEDEVHQGSHSRMSDTLEEHETRIAKLEHKAS